MVSEYIYVFNVINLNVIGNAKNVYFTFDTVNDIAIDVATEMVKELEIIDWDPLEIAVMIKKEVSKLIPNWEEWNNFIPKNHHQDSFNYENEEEEEDNVTPNPFYSCSSYASSSNSLQGFYSLYDNPHQLGGMNDTSIASQWFQGTYPLYL